MDLVLKRTVYQEYVTSLSLVFRSRKLWGKPYYNVVGEVYPVV
ncbi:hypothetical protein HMPREF9999_01675 [Alloprevotella sp. oral taxon 473 str. F0040]|nr:hypothetical protein HMPREF9999_01675 [Alloprevotella sp. oral taxon 473 str. F0040]